MSTLALLLADAEISEGTVLFVLLVILVIAAIIFFAKRI